jgi:hypothetical protein
VASWLLVPGLLLLPGSGSSSWFLFSFSPLFPFPNLTVPFSVPRSLFFLNRALRWPHGSIEHGTWPHGAISYWLLAISY